MYFQDLSPTWRTRTGCSHRTIEYSGDVSGVAGRSDASRAPNFDTYGLLKILEQYVLWLGRYPMPREKSRTSTSSAES